ncbi:hypothetical protein F2Q70_00038633 [Brassica cretica]|uniref:Uncharacterized protein n=1 Tax=Brassica cretica TaxID=69181 RepID=A0A8S9KE62_BRACR|nr:hypothetical protein F2Q70_00038633 [Brassica cretica]
MTNRGLFFSRLSDWSGGRLIIMAWMKTVFSRIAKEVVGKGPDHGTFVFRLSSKRMLNSGGGTRLEAGSSTVPGQKISRPPKVPMKLATRTGSLGKAQPTSNARTHGSEGNPISSGRKLVEKSPGVLDPRLAIPQTMRGGTLSTLSTTLRLLIRGNAELSAWDQPNRWHTTKRHDEQAETETSQ